MSDTSIRNLIETQENLGFRSERTLDWGSASTAMIGLIANHFGSAEHQLLLLPAG